MELGPYLILGLLEGLVTAAVLSLMALGLSLVFGVMRVVNVSRPIWGIGAVGGNQPEDCEVVFG